MNLFAQLPPEAKLDIRILVAKLTQEGETADNPGIQGIPLFSFQQPYARMQDTLVQQALDRLTVIAQLA